MAVKNLDFIAGEGGAVHDCDLVVIDPWVTTSDSDIFPGFETYCR